MNPSLYYSTLALLIDPRFMETLPRFMMHFKGIYPHYNGKKIQIGHRASIFGYVIDLPKCNNF